MLTEEYFARIVGDSRFQQRFWSKVEKSDSCWTWTGTKQKRGYGVIGFYDPDKKSSAQQLAHRMSWRFAHGAIQKGLDILHSCDKPPCVNPAHLHTGTHAENMAEASSRKRFPIGAKNWRTRLTEEQVREIRATQGLLSGGEMARRLGISAATVNDIRRNLYWKHVI